MVLHLDKLKQTLECGARILPPLCVNAELDVVREVTPHFVQIAHKNTFHYSVKFNYSLEPYLFVFLFLLLLEDHSPGKNHILDFFVISKETQIGNEWRKFSELI
jgi:hypothetical protein